MEPTHQTLDPKEVPITTPSRSHHRGPQGRLQATRPHTQTRDPSPHSECHGRHWVPELPGRTTAPGQVTPHRSRPHPCEPHHALGQRQQLADPGSRLPENQSINHRPGNQRDGLLLPHRIETVPDSSHVHQPDADLEQLPTRHGRKRDCHENPDQTNATTD